ADRMAVMFDGRVVQEGPIAQVWAGPTTPRTASFLGYAGIHVGDAAAELCRVAGLVPADWVALRRSALRVEPDGVLHATVSAVTSTPEQLRLKVGLVGVGEVDAVAPLDHALAVGDDVRLTADATRMATAPS